MFVASNLLKNKELEKEYTCPNCKSPYGYPQGSLIVCPECGHEWSDEDQALESSEEGLKVFDANGNELFDGDDVTVIKDLPVKGAPKPIKAGTKVKNIRLQEGDHDIDCKIPGFGAMALKGIFVKKA